MVVLDETFGKSEHALLGLEGALALDRKSAGELFARYVNPGLKTLLSLVGFDRSFRRAEGVYVYDDSGNRYLDFLGGYGSLPFGHNPKDIIAAVSRVEDRPNFLQAHVSPFQAALAHDLAQITPGDLELTFFSNSGTEAVEAAIKLARAATGEAAIVYCTGGFHGKTLGSLSVSGREKYKKPFEPLVPGPIEVPFGDTGALETVLANHRAAAFIVEPIQGEAGVMVPPHGYLRKVREITREHGVLLIFDEVQTGFGRTGTMFACQHEDVAPDIMCLAKALGGGVMPIGATIATRRVWEKAYGSISRAILHTSTFGGGARACAAALESIRKIHSERLWERAAELGNYFLDGLKTLKDRYKLIDDVRGKGLLIGLEFQKPAGGLLDQLTAGSINKVASEYLASLVASDLLERHHIITAYTLNNPNVMRLEPPLTVAREDIDYVLNALEDTFKRHKGFFSLAMSAVRRRV